MSYAERIKEVRKNNGISQERLAETLGVSRQCVTKWESGRCYPSVENLLIMANEFNASIDWFFADEIKNHFICDGEDEHDWGEVNSAAKKMVNRDSLSYFSAVSTGFNELDKSIKGLVRHDMYVVAGPPCMGKTAFALGIANNIAKNGIVLWFSFKETKDELWQKLLNMEAKIEHRGVTEKYTELDKKKIMHAAEMLQERNLELIADFDFSIEHMMERIVGQERKIDLIVIDSLEQLMTKRTSDKQEAERVIAESLGKIKKICDCPVIIVDGLDIKLTDGDYSGFQKMPVKHEKMLSRMYYHKWVLYRKNYYHRHAERSDGRVDAEVFMSNVEWDAKESAKETANLIFDYKTYSFEDTDIHTDKPVVDMNGIYDCTE